MNTNSEGAQASKICIPEVSPGRGGQEHRVSGVRIQRASAWVYITPYMVQRYLTFHTILNSSKCGAPRQASRSVHRLLLQ